MKRYRLIQTACLAALAVGLASCSQDDLASLGVAEGAPVTFTATGLAMPQVETRATTDGTWEEGMMVGVKIGSEAKEYAVSPDATDPTKATLAATQGVTPFYWANATETKSVEAWYPYTAGQTAMPTLVVQQDQSVEANYLASDLLGTSQEVSYGDTDLQFAHRTAKITLNFTETEGSRFSMKDAEVVLYNLSTTNGNPATIRCLKATGDGTSYQALIAPQTFAAGNALFYVKFADGSPHSYTPDAAIEFEAGYQYVFTITLTDTGMKVTVGEAIPWGDEVSSENTMVISEDGYYVTTDADGRQTYYVSNEAGLNAWSEYTNDGNYYTNLVLLDDITLTPKANNASNFTPIGTTEAISSFAYYGTIEGNGHTIYNMVVNNPYANYAGMVIISCGIVRNLTIGSGSYFRTRYTCGSVVSANDGGQVINCHSAATIEAIVPSVASWIDSSYGGVVANNRGYNSYVVGCSFSGKITADLQSRGQKTFLGGVVGSSWTTGYGNDVQVIGCLSSGEVTLKNSPASAQTHVGGIVGSCYKNGDDIIRVASCAMTGKVKFENVYKRSAEYSAFDAGVGHLYNSPSATHVYWTPGSIDADWQQPYRTSSGTYDTLMEVDGSNITWATAVDNMNAAIETWNAANGNLCPVHYVLTGNKPVLMKNQE